MANEGIDTLGYDVTADVEPDRGIQSAAYDLGSGEVVRGIQSTAYQSAESEPQRGIQSAAYQMSDAEPQRGIESAAYQTVSPALGIGINAIVLTTEAVRTDHGQYYR